MNMKKLFTVIIAIAVIFGFAGCPTEPEEEKAPPATTLRITNQSSYDLLGVTYSTVEFGDITAGKDTTKDITADSKPVYFNLKIFNTDVNCKTNELITCDAEVATEQAITNNTTVTAVDSNQSGTLREVYDALIAAYSKPLLELSQGDTVIANNEPLPFDFGTVEVGTNKSFVFTIKSIGNVPLELTGDPLIVSSNAVFSVPTQPGNKTINSGASLSFLVQYSPTAEKEDTGTITILNNSESMVFTLNIKGNGYQKKPRADVYFNDIIIPQNGTVNAGEVLVTLSKIITVTVKNTGDAPMTIDTENITITGADVSAFTRITSPSINIPIGEQTSFDITCTPVKLGENTATLSIKTNDPVNDPVLVQLRVTGVQGSGILELSREDGTVITNNDINPIDFEVVEMGYNKSLKFTIKNTGNIALALTGNPMVDSSNTLFQVSSQPLNNTIEPGGTVTFYIRYTPTGEAGDTGDITITNNSSAGTFGFKVKGTGYQKKPQITVTQEASAVNPYSEHDFGTVATDGNKDITFTIGNSGDTTLIFEVVGGNRINLVENTSGFFTVITQPVSNTVAPGSTASFAVRYKPTEVGTNHTATIGIKTNSRENDDFRFIVHGSSYQRQPQITVTQGDSTIIPSGEYDFGSTVMNISREITFTITNSGEANLTFVNNTGGNRIYVEDDTANAFAVTLQPLASTTVLPGTTSEFKIQFNPPAEETYLATVVVSTNSHENALLYFRVKGVGKGYQIGDTGPAGGLVFYDKGSVTDGWRYLEAAPLEIEGSTRWAPDGYSVSGTLVELGTGEANTTAIVNFMNGRGISGTAAQYCDALIFSGYDDWFLPSKDELALMYSNLAAKKLGNFNSNNYYWSSSQNSDNYAWCQTFGTNGYYVAARLKTISQDVRAVRAF